MLAPAAAHPHHDARVALHPAHGRGQPPLPRRRATRSSSTRSTPSRRTSAARTWRSRSSGSTRSPGRRLQRIGLSATQRPIEEVARLLVGAAARPAARPIVDVGHRRALDLSVEVPDQELGADRHARAVGRDLRPHRRATSRAHRTTIVFVNTRRLVERVAHALEERLGAGRVAAHHGSMARRTRLEAEERLKAGEVPVVVATASLELGIDVGTVDLVCHVGAPRALATLIQRVGRSGHARGAVPKGIVFPLTRDDLVQAAAAVRAVRAGELDALRVPDGPLDILAQQCVATVATGEIGRRRAAARSSAAPIRSATCRAPTSTPCSRCCPRASRRGAAGASALPPPRPRATAACARAAARGSPRSPAAAPSPTPPTTRSVEEPQGAAASAR